MLFLLTDRYASLRFLLQKGGTVPVCYLAVAPGAVDVSVTVVRLAPESGHLKVLLSFIVSLAATGCTAAMSHVGNLLQTGEPYPDRTPFASD